MIHYKCEWGGRWPDCGGGGFGHAGFTRLDGRWHLDKLLWDLTVLPRYQPRAGTALVTDTVPPLVIPGMDYVQYVYNDSTGVYSNGGGGNLCFRIYVNNVPVYTIGQPWRYYWRVDPAPARWVWEVDVDSPYYMASGVQVVPAGWGNAIAAWTAPCFFPDGVTGLYSTYYGFVRTVPFPEGEYTVTGYIQTQNDAVDMQNPATPPEAWDSTSIFSFTVGGYPPFDQVAPYEGLVAGVPTYDLFAVPEPPTPVAPIISNVTPAPGTPLAPTDHLALDATDDSGLFRRTILKVELWDGTTLLRRDMVWDGDTFDPLYAGSTVAAITGGFHFDLVRAAGWPAHPVSLSFTGYLFDQQGSENA